MDPQHPTASPLPTEQVDSYVSRAGAGLAAWLAIPTERRRALVEDLGIELLQRLDAAAAEIKAAPDRPTDLYDVTRESLVRTIAMGAEERQFDPEGFRPGICAFVHQRYSRPDKYFATAISAALLHDSVAVVRFSVGASRLVGATVHAARHVGMPDGVITVVSGEDETIDALISSPLVATVLADGPPEQIAHVSALAKQFAKAFIDYPLDERFR